jgi:hypothetical protein
LYAIADATMSLNVPRDSLRVVSIGVGEYPARRAPILNIGRFARLLPAVRLLQKTLEVNTQSMDQLRSVLFGDIPTVRINEAYTQPEMATDMFEHDLAKLDVLWQRGRQSFAPYERTLRDYLA